MDLEPLDDDFEAAALQLAQPPQIPAYTPLGFQHRSAALVTHMNTCRKLVASEKKVLKLEAPVSALKQRTC